MAATIMVIILSNGELNHNSSLPCVNNLVFTKGRKRKIILTYIASFILIYIHV